MQSTPDSAGPGLGRRILAALTAVIGTIIWAHALAGLSRAALGITVEDLAPAAGALTLAAVVAALAGVPGYPSRRRAAGLAAIASVAAALGLGALYPEARLPAASLVPAAVAFAMLGAWLAARLPAALDGAARRRRALAIAWGVVALVSVVQVGRLTTYMTDRESDWFLSTRHPFYAKHECVNAFVYGAELDRRGEPNVYDAAHYPGLNPAAEPETAMRGMAPEDPFQYAPQFLLWPRLAIEATHDYAAIRVAWFGVNVTLCLAAVLLLAAWVGGRVGLAAGLLAPAVLASFPVLYDFQYGQFHFAMLALAVLAMLAFSRGRSALGGALLAVAILSKLFPALLLIPLAVQRRWRDLAFTAASGAVLTLIALAVLGPAPFVAFLDYQLPRLQDGSAFAFGEAWPDYAGLITAGNQGVFGMVEKLEALGVPGAGAALATAAGRVYGVALLLLGVWVGLRTAGAGRAQRAVSWLGLLGLASLASTGAWADYVPLTCVWLLAFLIPLAAGRPRVQVALGVCAVTQVSLIGTVPLGGWTGAEWMIPLSLLSALAMLFTFAAGTLVPVRAAAVATASPRTWGTAAPALSRALRR